MTRFDFDIDEMDPPEAHDAWSEMTNLDADELREVRESERNEVYLQRAEGNEESDQPIPGGPLEDAIHLAETPREEWGPDERAEAAEAENFLNRTLAQFDQGEGEALVKDPPKVHKDEMSLIRWAFDPEPEDQFP